MTKLLGDVRYNAVYYGEPAIFPDPEVKPGRRMVHIQTKLSLHLYVVDDPVEPKYLARAGELIGPVIREKRGWLGAETRLSPQAEPPAKVVYSPYTLDSFRRMAQAHIPATLEAGLFRLDQAEASAHSLAEALGGWQDLEPDRRDQVRYQLRKLAGSLLSAHTSMRLDAGERFLAAKDITDVLGRLNPQAKGLQVAAAAPRLARQREFDQRSQRANTTRAQAIAEIDQRIDSYLARLFFLLEQPPGPAVYRQIGKTLDQLMLKPYYHPANLAGWLLGLDPVPEDALPQIRRAFIAEQLLRQYDAAMSEIRRRLNYTRLQIFLSQTLANIRSLQLGPYTRLAARLSHTDGRLKQAVMLTDPKLRQRQLRKLATEAKTVIRFRTAGPDSRIWLPPHLHRLLD